MSQVLQRDLLRCAVILLLELSCHFPHTTQVILIHQQMRRWDMSQHSHIKGRISLTSSLHAYFVCTLCSHTVVSHPTLDEKLHLSLSGSLEAIFFFSLLPCTNSKQIKRKIRLNWGGLAGSDNRECLAYKVETDQITLCQLCLRTTIFKSKSTSQVL